MRSCEKYECDKKVVKNLLMKIESEKVNEIKVYYSQIFF
jgi:hypothetical protein